MHPHGHKDATDRSIQNEKLVQRLQKMATGALCDSDKLHRQLASKSDDPELKAYEGLRLMCPSSMKLRNPISKHERETTGRTNVMVGIARTVQLTRTNDFLGVLYALSQARQKEVLVVNTCGSTRAVAGSLFSAEAARRGNHRCLFKIVSQHHQLTNIVNYSINNHLSLQVLVA
jgi:hypothetical protein